MEDLRSPDAIILDDLYRRKLGVTRVGEVFEIGGHRARVVGFTHGIRSFTTSPYVFTSFKNAQNYTGLREDQTLFVLVKVAPGWRKLRNLSRCEPVHESSQAAAEFRQ